MKTIEFSDQQLTMFGTVSLGALIAALKPLQLRPDHEEGDYLGPNRWVTFDFCGLGPKGVAS